MKSDFSNPVSCLYTYPCRLSRSRGALWELSQHISLLDAVKYNEQIAKDFCNPETRASHKHTSMKTTKLCSFVKQWGSQIKRMSSWCSKWGNTCLQLGLAFLRVLLYHTGSLWNTSEASGAIQKSNRIVSVCVGGPWGWIPVSSSQSLIVSLHTKDLTVLCMRLPMM